MVFWKMRDPRTGDLGEVACLSRGQRGQTKGGTRGGLEYMEGTWEILLDCMADPGTRSRTTWSAAPGKPWKRGESGPSSMGPVCIPFETVVITGGRCPEGGNEPVPPELW